MKADDISPEGAAAIAPADLSAVTVVVCATCRDDTGSDAHPRAGAILAQQHEGRGWRRSARHHRRMPRQLQAPPLRRDPARRLLELRLRRPDSTDSGPDLIAGAKLFAGSTDGLIPWRGRPDSLKRGLVARIPPLDLLKDIA